MFYDSAVGSKAFFDYITVIRDIGERDEPVVLSKICKLRDKYANKIILELGCMDLTHEAAFEYAHRILTVIDTIELEDKDWIDPDEIDGDTAY